MNGVRRLAMFALSQLSQPARHRQWAIDANDGIIATAGVLQGFAGAGAGDRLLLFSATAATIAGGLSTGGSQWAEVAAERDAQLVIQARERGELSADPDAELLELVAHWEHKGLSPELARDVAEQLHARDALAAQLEWEFGFDSPMSRSEPWWAGATSAVAYTLGALIPLLITYFAPVAIETWAVLAAVVLALVLTTLVAARTAGLDPKRLLLRSLAVGALTISVSYAVGSLLL